MAQEHNFTQLIVIKITRLLKPALALPLNIDQSLIPHIGEYDISEDTEELQIENDISDQKISCDDMFIFPTKFGYFF